MNAWLLVPWIGLCLSYFGFVEIRVLCSHCPHYAEPGTRSLQCWANYGSPKLWKYRPGPLTIGESFVFFTGLVLIAAYPLAFLVAGEQWLLLILFLLAVPTMATLMGRWMCSRCINFSCPLNCVSKEVREAYLAQNPILRQAWEKSGYYFD